MNEYVEQILARNRTKGALIDTNLLLLLFVGSIRRELIPNFKRVSKFAVEDFDTIVNVVGYFGKILTTPNILTEVSNLAGQLSGTDRNDCFESFASTLTLLKEEYVPSEDVVPTEHFRKFGITDAGIIHFARGKYLVVTDDFPLYHLLSSSGGDALNFYHLAPMNWDFKSKPPRHRG